jgi:outer membrane receptor protein involved in Fe transport
MHRLETSNAVHDTRKRLWDKRFYFWRRKKQMKEQMRKGLLRSLMFIALVIGLSLSAHAQLDQGAIMGTVTDPQGAVVPHVKVRITNVDTNFTLETQTDANGGYTFQPLRIGHYSVTVSGSGFSTTTKSGLELHVAERLQADLRLQVGTSTESVQVTADSTPLLQTEEASTGQVLSTQEVNEMPLNGRNFVFVAQLAAGVAPSNGSRGQGNGDFIANGQRATQNNFILDGVDNNSNAIDFLNGASYVIKPPPDALQEFKVQTGSFSAEFGHSAGAVINTSIKSGTNKFHGNVWEYVRNNALGEASPATWYSTTGKLLPYHQNQFGGTIGGPILKNKLFFFGDYEGNRIAQSATVLTSVPTALERIGDFSELLNTSLTGATIPELLYEPGSAGTKLLGTACGSTASNVMCASEFNSIAKTLLALYPAPNTNGGKTYNNYTTSRHMSDNTNQFDVRVDYNISATDQLFSRVSWSQEDGYRSAPLGPILDGGATDDDGTFINHGKSAVVSENHVFSPTLVNQLRFGYNWGSFAWLQQSDNVNLAAKYGLGGVPFQSMNGGLPNIGISGVNGIGTPTYQPSPEGQNVYQIIDDLTKILGRHTLKFGVDLQNIRYSVLQPTCGHECYGYDGHFTGNPGVSYTGSGVADFLADYMNSDSSSGLTTSNLGRWYRAVYVQDDWKVAQRLTVNLGLRYDFFQLPIERHDHQALFYYTSPINVPGAGTGVYMLPSSQKNVALDTTFVNTLAKDNIKLLYSDNRSLVESQKTNFAPRIGISYQVTNRLVARSGFGIFYGGVENLGNYPNIALNYPFYQGYSWPSPSCTAGMTSCATNGASLKGGPPSGGLSQPSLAGQDPQFKSAYSIEENLSLQYSITNDTSLTVGYVGSGSRHLPVVVWPNFAAAVAPSGTNTQYLQPFPDFSAWNPYVADQSIANYHGLQTTLQRKFTSGLSFLSSYTWSHSLDDSREPLPSNGEGGDLSFPIFGLRVDYANSPFDVRQRFTFTGTYDLPFGVERKYLHSKGIVDILAGGWSSTMMFRAETGQPFSVSGNGTTVAGASTFAALVGDPFKGGGTPQASNPNITCPAKVRTLTNWYNPCAFANPAYPTSFGTQGYITGAANVRPYLGGKREQIDGPGYERIDMSMFKNFNTFESQHLEFRADIFNLFNTPTWGPPSNTGIQSNGGLITSTRTLGNYTPDARFFQLAMKYYF